MGDERLQQLIYLVYIYLVKIYDTSSPVAYPH